MVDFTAGTNEVLGDTCSSHRVGEALAELLRVDGAVYSCVADPATGELVAEAGIDTADGLPVATVLDWAGLDVVADEEFDDLVITCRRAFHLVRRVGPVQRSLLVYLRLDRRWSNLVVARRALASSRPASGLDGGGPGRRVGGATDHPLPDPGRDPAAPAIVQAEPVVPSESADWSRDAGTLRRLLVGLRALRDE